MSKLSDNERIVNLEGEVADRPPIRRVRATHWGLPRLDLLSPVRSGPLWSRNTHRLLPPPTLAAMLRRLILDLVGWVDKGG